ncbi:TIGR04141 family sporadically distributed protein [Pseudoalteromonas sp. B530]|uniref:TIGR04141 family sporadically distributed protein n=1 Tax=Pseudoalteromonas sp. B530 TaxID=2994390 RepID=UPI00224B6A38|nr:TIGR04141 family sporadically distributed protein [Pseudoalteromonas sp. B530]MCX2768992.1 TIGR04141 family sporadically distributed protein [Pseudoalteromonas sp. B530]
MKRNVVAFLGKKNLSIDELLDNTKAHSKHYLDPSEQSNNVLCLAAHKSPAEWSALFSSFKVDEKDFQQRTVKGVYFVKVEDRYVIYTFGYGRCLVNKSSIERGFGLRVSMNLGDPEQLKSIDKATLERVARNTRSQVLKKSSIQDFHFEFDHEILKSLTAIVDNGNDCLEMVSGNDSVSLYTEIEFEKFACISERLIDAYLSQDYKERYPWAEFIGIESDPTVIEKLEAKLLQRLNEILDSKEDEPWDVWLAPPEIIDYANFAGFVYPAEKRQGHSSGSHPEMNLRQFLLEANFQKKKGITIKTLKSKYIFLVDGTERILDKYRAYDALNGEFSLDEVKYVLNDGRWYHVKTSFAQEVESYFDKLPRWKGLECKPYHDLRECCYLRRIADDEEIALLDQHWVRNKEVPQNYEFCDLMTKDNRLIHVKHYGGSNVISHLLAQASNGVEMLLNSPEIVPQVQEHLQNTTINFYFDRTKPRQQTIVLAIIQARKGELHLPFFSKVNLRHHARNIQNKGFTVELAKIPVDKLETARVKDSGVKCKCQARTAECTKELTG